MRPPILRLGLDANELVIDNFAGGGGASTGIEEAIGRPIDIAINHDPVALAVHAANHPNTRHLCESVWDVDPVEACGGRPVGLAWFSPDCKHFSRAKGDTPRSDNIRGLAWVVIRWAQAVRPRVICLENVQEFTTWGPLDEDGKPIRSRAGETFADWLAQLRALGYVVEVRQLVAADYGAPTTRRRLFIVARCDGQRITWPAPTHGRATTEPWRPAADIIDWSLPCPSIFGREKPLAEATLRRIAEGVRRYVIGAADPFVVRTPGGVVAPTLIQRGWGERKGQRPRAMDIRNPLGTIVAGGIKHALVAAFITKHYKGVIGHGVQRPLGTITAIDHHSLTTAALELPGESADRRDKAAAFLIKYYGGSGKPESQRQSIWAPLHVVTTKARFGLVVVEGVEYVITDIGMRMVQPRELFCAQGFPGGYLIDVEHPDGGKLIGKTDQIRLAGNSVPPPLARALAAEQFSDPLGGRRTA